MRPNLLAAAIAVPLSLLAAQIAQAGEGMWVPQQLPEIAGPLKKAGLKLSAQQLSDLTGDPLGAVVSLGGCTAGFVSPQGLVVTNHHCIYNSVAVNSTPERDLLANGFLAKTFAEELPAAPGSRVYVTEEVANVTNQIITPEVAKLTGKARIDAIEKNQKKLVAECEQTDDEQRHQPVQNLGSTRVLHRSLIVRGRGAIHGQCRVVKEYASMAST